MAEELDDEEEGTEEDEYKPSLLRRIFSAAFLERAISEVLRLVIFAIVAFFIAYLVNQRNSSVTTIGQQSGQLGDTNAAGNIITRPLGVEWSMEEMIINTADELDNHFVKAIIVISCEAANPVLISELEQRSGEVHAEVREIIGSKSYLSIKRVEQQKILAQELKTRIQRIIGKPGIIDVFLKEFSVH